MVFRLPHVAIDLHDKHDQMTRRPEAILPLVPCTHMFTLPMDTGAPLSRSERQVAKIALRGAARRLQHVAITHCTMVVTRDDSVFARLRVET